MVNSEIFITQKSEYKFSQQDETQKSHLNGEETKFYKWVNKCFSRNDLVTKLISKKFQCLNLFLVQYVSNHFEVWSKKSYHFYQSFSWAEMSRYELEQKW